MGFPSSGVLYHAPNHRGHPDITAQATFGGVALEKCGLIFPRPVALNAWQRIGEQLLATVDSSTWWLADWLAYGETAFRDRYREIIRTTSLSYQTLRNYTWVARRFELSRRRDKLSFGHHAEVAALRHPEQDYWLRKAEEFGWSRNKLRAEVRTSLRDREDGEVGPSGTIGPGSRQNPSSSVEESVSPPEVLTLVLSLTRDQHSLLTVAASLASTTLHEWALTVLCQEASR